MEEKEKEEVANTLLDTLPGDADGNDVWYNPSGDPIADGEHLEYVGYNFDIYYDEVWFGDITTPTEEGRAQQKARLRSVGAVLTAEVCATPMMGDADMLRANHNPVVFNRNVYDNYYFIPIVS